MSYTSFRDGYLRETTFGSSIIPNAATQTYLWGAISQDSVHPSPTTSLYYRAVGVNTREVDAATDITKLEEILTGMYGIIPQNGVFLEAAMGKSSTAGADPYTHTITPSSTASLLPSFTIQHEVTGSGTDWATQYLGCKINELVLIMDYRGRYLVAMLNWVAAEAVDPNLGGTNAMLDDNPILPATATTPAYYWGGFSRTFAAAAAPLNGLKYMELSINSGLEPDFSARWDGATWKGRQAWQFNEAPRKQYKLTMRLHPQSDDLWDELVATGNTDDIVFKWTKSANDYIQATLSDCVFISHEQKTMVKDELMVEVVCEPRAISFEVKDAIAGDAAGAYGE